MQSAVEAVLNGTKYMTVAKQFQVDRMTLKCHVNLHRNNPSVSHKSSYNHDPSVLCKRRKRAGGLFGASFKDALRSVY